MSPAIVKVFNTVGPRVAEEHYPLPVLERQPVIEVRSEGVARGRGALCAIYVVFSR
jgi:hypothetical protein